MKKRILCAILSLVIAVSLVTLPTQAASKPAFQWLVDFTKREGLYDAANKTYGVSWIWDETQANEYLGLEYDLNDGNLYCWLVFHSDELYMVLTPNLDTPYQVILQNGHNYAAEYRVYPGVYTEKTNLQHTQYSGHEVYLRDVDTVANGSLRMLLETLNNLMTLSGSSYRIKDLGFTKFTRHTMHIYGDPVLEGEFHCGNNTYYRRYCLICGSSYTYYQWEDHIKGSIVWLNEPTCTDWGYCYNVCARCGEQIAGTGTRVKPLGHDWALISLDAPISDESHVQGHFCCKRCSEEKDDEYCAADFFKDMPVRGNWAHTPIDWAFANGITTGTSETKFSPDKGCTRGQVVTFLWRAAGCPEPEKTNTSFTDVKPGAFYEKAVAWAVEEGITNGKSATTFAPDATCTRGQIVTFLWRFKGSRKAKGAGDTFTDVGAKAFYAKAVAWAVENDVTNGMTKTNFAPDATCTRAQVVTFLYRAQKVSEAPAEDTLVGITMPTKDLLRWKQDGENMKKLLEEAGYEVDLRYAANDASIQATDICSMAADGAKVIVVSAVDGDALRDALKVAKNDDVKVIAYDRLIRNSDAVSYYVSFSNWQVGVAQGEYIENALDLKNAGDKVYNLEIVGGDPGDGNAFVFYDGAMSVLRKYIDAGTLNVASGQYAYFENVATVGWSTENARSRFETILREHYADQTLHAVLASNDSTALGVAAALADSYENDVYPVITGQDCDIGSVRNMLADKQAMSVIKDTRDLVAKTVEMVDAIMKDAEPPVNDIESINNGAGIIPSFLCEPRVCTKDNIQALFIDSGYYTWEDLSR